MITTFLYATAGISWLIASFIERDVTTFMIGLLFVNFAIVISKLNALEKGP